MNAQEWQPGDKALIEVEVTQVPGWVPNLIWVKTRQDHAFLTPAAGLLPVPVPDDDTMRAVTDHLAMFAHLPAGRRVDYGTQLQVAKDVAALLASPVREPGRSEAEVRMVPSEPHALPGFTGCTDRNPEVCACSHEQPVCHLCDRSIEGGEMVRSFEWPEYPGVPLDSPDQDWAVYTEHVDCDAARAAQVTDTEGGE